MKYTEEKGFSRFSKVIPSDLLENMIAYTKKEIEEKAQMIKEAKFEINPKIYGKDNISCTFCTLKDMCYKNAKDLVYLDKVEDLSFLGGEE